MAEQVRVPGIVGMAIETNCVYYREMHRAADVWLAPGRSLTSVIDTIDFVALVADTRAGDDERVVTTVIDSARRLERAGADFLVISSNTGHSTAASVKAAVPLPLLDIRDVAAEELRRRGVRRAGLVSTTMTLRRGLYDQALRTAGIELLEPDAADAAH